MLFSIFVRNRNAFLLLVAAVAAFKLVLIAVAPASSDLLNIILRPPIGPWIILYPPLYNQTASNINQLQSWALTASLGSNPSLAQLSLLFRLPVFLFDLATMIALFYIGRKMRSVEEGRLMGLVWFLNPFSFFGVELLGLPDVICVFLVALSYLLLISGRPFWSAAALGLGAFFKLFPIFLLPPLLIYMHVNRAPRRLLLSATVVGVIGILGYWAWALQYGLQFAVTPIPITQMPPFYVGIQNTLNPVTFGMFAFYCLLLIFKKKIDPLPLFLLTFLVYYLFAMPGPQYLIWLLPLLAVDVVLGDRLKALIVSAMLGIVFLQWFLVSSAFVTPSGYSLLMFPLGGKHLPSYSIAIVNFLGSDLTKVFVLPLVFSATFAFILAYAAEQIRSWFHAAQTE